jgi:hypothetical protein
MAGASGPVPSRPPHTEAERRSTRGVELVAQAATSKCASRDSVWHCSSPGEASQAIVPGPGFWSCDASGRAVRTGSGTPLARNHHDAFARRRVGFVQSPLQTANGAPGADAPSRAARCSLLTAAPAGERDCARYNTWSLSLLFRTAWAPSSVFPNARRNSTSHPVLG